jgi:hypothetical protein
VRLRILKKMPIIVRDIPILCTVLTGNIRLMFLDSNWRIRKELAVVMPEILQSMGQDYFSDNFLEDFLSLLKDDVGEVRVACAEALPLMTTPINAPWVHEKLFPGMNILCIFLHLLLFTVLVFYHFLKIILILSLDCFILTFLFYYLFYHLTVAVKELSGDEYLLRLSMISALQGLLKVSLNLSVNATCFILSVFCRWRVLRLFLVYIL